LQDVTIAVVGATGAVGAEFISILEHRHPNVGHIKLLASHRSAGKKIRVNGRDLIVQEANENSFHGVDIAFISVSSEVSLRLAPIAVAAGALVIDDSSAFRMQETVPLVVPEINGSDVTWHQGIISIPNCSTTQLVMAIYPLHRVNKIKRIIVDTYQAVSGAGGAPIVELKQQSRDILDGRDIKIQAMQKQIAFNLFPHIADFQPNGYTEEEEKMLNETRKIMHAPDILVSATCVRVPVYTSHSEAVHIEFERPMPVAKALQSLNAMPGVIVLDDPEQGTYPMPWNVTGSDDVYVGRVRQDVSHPNGIALWVVADNLRKGAALNSIQIAEEVLTRDCMKGERKSTIPT
jgi:aspartate-semialdehyde dehydrogenase